MAMVSVADPTPSVAPPAGPFVIIEGPPTHVTFNVVHSYGWGIHYRALMTLSGVLISNRCFYVLIIWSGVQVRQCHTPREQDIDTAHQLFLIVFFVPETYHPVLLRRKAIRLRKETGNQEWIAPIEKLDRSIAKTVLWSCIRPFQLLFLEPMVRSPMSPGQSLVDSCSCSVP